MPFKCSVVALKIELGVVTFPVTLESVRIPAQASFTVLLLTVLLFALQVPLTLARWTPLSALALTVLLCTELLLLHT